MTTEQVLPEDAQTALREAKRRLESPSLAAKLTQLVGPAVETGLTLLPDGANALITKATSKALEKALDFAVYSIGSTSEHSQTGVHKAAVAVTGAAGGAFGLPALVVELPVSTTIMLRSIAAIARAEGEPLDSVTSRLQCLEVFALGGKDKQDDEAESSYYAVRYVLSHTLAEAARYVSTHGVAPQVAPPVMRFLAQVAARFGIPISHKLVAQALPVMGAATGAAINTMFMDHFQNIARGHFAIRRLEREFGAEVVKAAYLALDEQV